MNSQKYGNVYVSGSSAAHLGDVHQHYYLQNIREPLSVDGLRLESPQSSFTTSMTMAAAIREEILQTLSLDENTSVFMAEPYASSLGWVLAPNTCGIYEWLQSSQPLFWVSGNPGSGKSVVMNYLSRHEHEIANLVRGDKASPTSDMPKIDFVAVMHRFSRKNAVTMQRTENLFRSLLHALLVQRPALVSQAFPTVSTLAEFRAQYLPWSLSQLQKALEAAVRSSIETAFFLQIDGLDEFDGDYVQLASAIRWLADKSPPNLKVMVASRPYQEFQIDFKSFPTIFVERHTTADIASYVNERFREAESFLGHQYILLAQQVIQRANGVFLWVRLVVDSLQRGWRCYEDLTVLFNKLEEMPQDLVDLYQQILEELPTQDKSDAERLILIVVAAKQPLRLEELKQAALHCQCQCAGDPQPLFCEVRHEHLSTDDKHIARFEGRLHAICRGLLQVSGSGDASTSIHLLHSTLVAFIHTRLQFSGPISHLSPAVAGHGLLLQSCVHYMRTVFNTMRWQIMHSSTEREVEKDCTYYNLGKVSVGSRDYVDICMMLGWQNALLGLHSVRLVSFHDLEPILCQLDDAHPQPYYPFVRSACYPLELSFLPYAVRYWLEHAKAIDSSRWDWYFLTLDTLTGRSFDLWRLVFQIHHVARARSMPCNKIALAIDQGLFRYARHALEALQKRGRRETYHVLECPNEDVAHYLGYLLFVNSRNGTAEMAKDLIDLGARLRDSDSSEWLLHSYGGGALLRAVHFNNVDVVGMLCRRGTPLKVSNGQTMSRLWLRTGGIYRVRALGAYTVRQESGISVLRSRRTVKGGRTFTQREDGEVEVTGAGFASRVSDGLLHAIMDGWTACFSAILANTSQADVQRSLDEGLILAAQLGRVEFVKGLLRSGADPGYVRPGWNCHDPAGKPCCAIVVAGMRRDTDTVSAIKSAPMLKDLNVNALSVFHQCEPKHLEHCAIYWEIGVDGEYRDLKSAQSEIAEHPRDTNLEGKPVDADAEKVTRSVASPSRFDTYVEHEPQITDVVPTPVVTHSERPERPVKSKKRSVFEKIGEMRQQYLSKGK